MTKFIEKINAIDKKIDNKLVHKQVKEINNIVKLVSNKQVLPKKPARLGLYPDEIEELQTTAKANDVKVMNNLLNSVRQFLSLKFGIWSLANKTTAELIRQELKVDSALEIMAGNAYWSKALKEAGILTTATDSLEWAKTSTTGQDPFYPVEDLEAEKAIRKYKNVDLILCSWSPNFGNSDLNVISAWKEFNPSAHLLFIGEKNGATNSREFWRSQHFKKTPEIAKINQSFVSYDFIDEKIFEIDEL